MSFTGMLTLILAIRAAGGGGTPPAADNAPGMHEVFPSVRADLAAKVMEFDGEITPMLVKDDRAPLFYLEVLACSPNTREHETLAISAAKPSHIHAAMLLIGLTPGKPGGWLLENNQLVPREPTGDRLRVRFIYTDKDGHEIEADPLDWVINAKDNVHFADSEKALADKHKDPAPGWVFAGSKMVKRKSFDGTGAPGEEREIYDADGAGTILGLTTFGGETIAWSRVISPDASVEEPEWIADFSKTPPAGIKVRIRVRKAD